jgi:short-subunit dehydrogenase
MKLEGKTVIITGASSGIGAATALELARHKANLVLAARRMDKLEQVADKCRRLGANVVALPCDVARRADVDRAVKEAVGRFARLDVMLANAGYGFLAKIHETTEEQFDEIVATNVKGTFYAMQAAAEVMMTQKAVGGGKAARGQIIAISSGAARRGLPLYGVYSMTKAAQLSLAEAMRVELAKNKVYVSTVHPLTTATEFFEVASSRSRLKSTGLNRAQPVEVVARKIVRLMVRPKPELWPVFGSRFMLAFGAAFPRVADWTMARTVYRRTR